MTPQERQELEDRIHEQIELISQDIVNLVEETKPVAPDDAYGRVSRMDAISSKSVSEASLRMARTKLERLKTALTKLDDPKFGKCTACGKSIQPKRLMFLPESTRCVNCADR